MPVFVWDLSGSFPVFVRNPVLDFTGQVPARLIEPKILFTEFAIISSEVLGSSSSVLISLCFGHSSKPDEACAVCIKISFLKLLCRTKL